MSTQEIQIRFADNLIMAMNYVCENTNVNVQKLAKFLKIPMQEAETILRHIEIQ